MRAKRMIFKNGWIFGLLMFVVLFLMVPTLVLADAYEARPHNWRNKHTFQKNVTFKQDILVEGTLNAQAYGPVWYVSSVTGADVPDWGKGWKKPFATMNYAMNFCTANYGDVVVLLPGHNEGITTAAGIDLDIAGVTVIGTGTGSKMATIDSDHADATFVIGADNVTVINLRFRTSADAVTVGVKVEDAVDYATFIGCEWGYAETASDEYATALQFNDASNNGWVQGCAFHAGAQAAVAAITFNKDTDLTVLADNWFTGTYSTAPILGATTASTNLLITRNHLFTSGTADTFNLVAASTGIVSHNIINMNAASAATALDIGNCLSFENYLIADDDVGGTKSAIEAGSFGSVTPTADD
jgi:hypothetical protein